MFCRIKVSRDDWSTWRSLFVYVEFNIMQGMNDGEVSSCRVAHQSHCQVSSVSVDI